MKPSADSVGLLWPMYGGHIWLRKVEAPAAATIEEEELAREGFTIKGIARPPKPPQKPRCPYERGSYMWEKWVEEEAQLEAVVELVARRRRRGRIHGKLYH
jgi:hypothetical protein